MKVLSLFDGISIAQQALKNVGIDVEKYYASEIDKYAIQITQKNFPNTIQIGDVKNVNGTMFHDIDLLIGGSPCQDLSIAKKDRKGLDGERSGLFWEYVRILKEVKPKYFILENVNSMPKEAKKVITEELGVEPIMINASLVSAQNRKRLFWTNIPNVTIPEDRGILLKDILDDNVDEKYNISAKLLYTFLKPSGKNGSFPPIRIITKDDKAVTLTARYYKMGRSDNYIKRIGCFNHGGQGDRVYSIEGKSVSLSANGGGKGAKTGLYKQEDVIRKLTPIECERLQSLPDNYTEGISNTQRYKALGNGFNCAVIEHILKHIF